MSMQIFKVNHKSKLNLIVKELWQTKSRMGQQRDVRDIKINLQIVMLEKEGYSG